MKVTALISTIIVVLSVAVAHATVYTGVMDNRTGFPLIPGFTAQSLAWATDGSPGGGLRLEWQADDETVPGSWTYTYRLLRGTAKNKGFAFFDIETAGDFTAADIKSREVLSATDRFDQPIPSGLSSITISDPVNFDAVHDFSNAAVTEANFATVLNKTDLSHYSGDPGRVPPGQPGGKASATPSVGPVPHPFYGIRVTFPGAFSDRISFSYETSQWEFRIVTDRGPMWGSFFGWGDQTFVAPYWYANFYNENIDNPNRLTLVPASTDGAAPYRGWILVPGTAGFTVLPDGILSPGAIRASVADALKVLRISLNLLQPTPDDLNRGDVAPLGSDGRPQPDGKIDIKDAVVILRKAVGLVNW